MRQLRTLLPAAAATVAMSAIASQAQAQRRVTGIITGEGGAPLSAASVQIVGTQTGTYTNEAGRFAIQAGAGTQTLRVRRIGFRAQTVTVGPGQTDVGTINLTRDVLQLEAQVVTGTATSVSRANAANAVAQVTATELNRAPAQTVDNALQGKVAGAIISTNSGAPGGGTQVQLRGVTSVNASASPLYVVDGVLISNQSFGNGLNSLTSAGAGITTSQDQQVNRVADLNPEDIESIEVLKGPSAGAIYGSKASNGVIVIRTKRGSGTRPQWNLSQRLGNYSLQGNRKLNMRCFHSIAEINGYLDNYSSGTAADYGITSDNGIPCYDYQNEFYDGNGSGPSYQSNVALSGGTAGGTTYRIAGFGQRDNGIQRGTYYNKQSLSANVGQTVGKRLTLQSNNEFLHTLTDRGLSGNDNTPVVSPVSVFSNTPQFYNLMAKNPAGQYVSNPFLDGAGSTNPFQNAQIVKTPQDVFRYIGSVNATYNAYAGERQTFDISVLGGLDIFNQNNKLNSPPEAYFEPADGFPGTIVNTNVTSQYANLNVTGVHRYTVKPFTATTSFGLRHEYRNSDAAFDQGRTIPSGAQNIGLAAFQSLTEQRFRVFDTGVFAQEEFLTLNERLLLTGAINAERSTVNGASNHFYAFPKAAASYRVPITLPKTDEFKLRFAYGKAGNQPSFGLAYTALPVSLYGGTQGAQISTFAGNNAIRPEISTEIEGGIDWNLFRGRLGLEATLFRDNVKDLVLNANTAFSTGFAQQAVNAGAFYKTGTELSLNATPVQLKHFTWISRTTFATVNSRVTSLQANLPTGTINLPCQNVGAYFSARYGAPWLCKGNSITTVQAQYGWDSTFSSTGAFVSRAAHYNYYESLPRFNMGFSNDFNVGPVRLSGLVDWRKGGKVANLTNNYFDGTNLFADTIASQTRLSQFSTLRRPVYLENGTFVKLREINASYALPTQFVHRYLGGRADALRVEFSGRNLYTWSKYTGYDPEVSNFGNQNLGRFQDVTPYPPSRSYFFSVSANF